MRSFNRKAVLIAVFVMLLAAVMPAAAGRTGIGLTAETVGCTIIIEFTMPFPAQGESRLDGKTFARVAAGGGTNTVYVLIFDNGVLIASIPVTGPILSLVQAIYQVDRYYDLEDIDIVVSDDDSGEGFYFGVIEAYSVPNSVYDSCQGEEIPTVASPACPYPLSNVTLGQGRVIFPTEVFWAPSFNALTDVVLPVGTSWWILEARDGFYKLFVACQAQYVWVPAESLGANFDVVWGGRPLPPAGDLP